MSPSAVPAVGGFGTVNMVYLPPELFRLGNQMVHPIPFGKLKKIQSFRFLDADDYENEIFPILSRTCAQSNVILAGKFDNHRHSTTRFSQKVVVRAKSYQILEF